MALVDGCACNEQLVHICERQQRQSQSHKQVQWKSPTMFPNGLMQGQQPRQVEPHQRHPVSGQLIAQVSSILVVKREAKDRAWRMAHRGRVPPEYSAEYSKMLGSSIQGIHEYSA